MLINLETEDLTGRIPMPVKDISKSKASQTVKRILVF